MNKKKQWLSLVVFHGRYRKRRESNGMCNMKHMTYHLKPGGSKTAMGSRNVIWTSIRVFCILYAYGRTTNKLVLTSSTNNGAFQPRTDFFHFYRGIREAKLLILAPSSDPTPTRLQYSILYYYRLSRQAKPHDLFAENEISCQVVERRRKLSPGSLPTALQ